MSATAQVYQHPELRLPQIGSELARYVSIGISDTLDDQNSPIARIPLRDAHLLIAGITGAGKTIGCRWIASQIMPCENTAILYFDGKLREALYHYPRASHVGLGPEAQRAGMLWLADEVYRRYAESLDIGTLRPKPIKISPEMPHIVAIFDEVHEAFKRVTPSEREAIRAGGGDDRRLSSLQDEFQGVMTLAREAEVTVILMTQKPGHDAIPTSIRDSTTARIGYRVTTSVANSMIFGSDSGIDATKILESQRGEGFVMDEHGRSRRFKTPYVPVPLLDSYVEATMHLRVDLTHRGLPHLNMPPRLRMAINDRDRRARGEIIERPSLFPPASWDPDASPFDADR